MLRFEERFHTIDGRVLHTCCSAHNGRNDATEHRTPPLDAPSKEGVLNARNAREDSVPDNAARNSKVAECRNAA